MHAYPGREFGIHHAVTCHRNLRCMSVHSSGGAVPPQTHLLELLLQARHVQACKIPATCMALAMQHQGAHMPKHLTAVLVAAQEGIQRAVIHPLPHQLWVDAPGADLGVQIQIHIQRGIPPLAETCDELCGVVEFRASTRFEMVDQARILAHRHVAAPTGERGRRMLGHVLLMKLVDSNFTTHMA
jgi:hypothetical protein